MGLPATTRDGPISSISRSESLRARTGAGPPGSRVQVSRPTGQPALAAAGPEAGCSHAIRQTAVVVNIAEACGVQAAGKCPCLAGEAAIAKSLKTKGLALARSLLFYVQTLSSGQKTIWMENR